jgi:hypothetical protein
MTLTSPRKIFWLAVVGTGCLVFLLLLLPAKPHPRSLDLLIAGRPQVTNSVMLISFVLSNGTSRALNIVDDAAGDPFLVLDAGTRGNMPGTIGLGLGALANTLKINLGPGAALTNAVRLTNPPVRFRLRVEVRDLAAERHRPVIEYRVAPVSLRSGKKPHCGGFSAVPRGRAQETGWERKLISQPLPAAAMAC